MNQHSKKYLIAMGAIVLLSGCAGYNRVLFLTKTNVGIDVSREPLPTAEITIARREVGILPTYQDTISGQEKTLPLFGAFSLSGGLFDPTISSVFAGGPAAVAIAKASDSSNNPATPDSSSSDCNENGKENDCDSITLSNYPDDRNLWDRLWNKPAQINKDKHQVKPFYFATDVSYGAKVAWDGTGGPYPTSLKIGYNRTEFAYPPVFVSESNDSQNNGKQYLVKIPSFYAFVQNRSRFTNPITDNQTGVAQVQVFATGKAAHVWAQGSSAIASTRNMIFPGSEPPKNQSATQSNSTENKNQ